MSTRVAGKLSERERQQIMQQNKLRKLEAKFAAQKEQNEQNQKTKESIETTESKPLPTV